MHHGTRRGTRRLNFLPALCAVSFLALPPAALAGSGVTQELSLRDFDRIEIEGVFDVEVEVGKKFSVVISGPADELDRVKAEVEGGTLVLGQKKKKRGVFGFNTGVTDVRARISMPDLTGLDIAGVVDVEVRGIRSDDLRVDVSGVGQVALAGRCGTLTVDLSGIADLDARDLHCRAVGIDVSGLGDASVHASDAVNAEVSGIGSVDVHGSPKVVRKNRHLFADIKIR